VPEPNLWRNKMKAVALLFSLIALSANDATANQSPTAEWTIDFEFNQPGRDGPGRPGPGRPAPGRPGFPGRPDHGRDEQIYRPINQEFRRDGRISLTHSLSLGRQHFGRKIKEVKLRASSQSYRRGGEARVSVNGRAVTASQRIDRQSGEISFFLPDHADELGREIQQIHIELRGDVYVDGVGVVLEREMHRPGPGPGFPQQEVININREFRGSHRFAIGTLVNLDRYRGMRLRSVSIQASSQIGLGDATFCGQRCSTQNIGRRLESYSFPVTGEIVDFNAHNWSIDLRGNIYVESIKLEFMR